MKFCTRKQFQLKCVAVCFENWQPATEKIKHWNILHASFHGASYRWRYIVSTILITFYDLQSFPAIKCGSHVHTFPLMRFILKVLQEVNKVTRWSNHNINHGLSALSITFRLLFTMWEKHFDIWFSLSLALWLCFVFSRWSMKSIERVLLNGWYHTKESRDAAYSSK